MEVMYGVVLSKLMKKSLKHFMRIIQAFRHSPTRKSFKKVALQKTALLSISIIINEKDNRKLSKKGKEDDELLNSSIVFNPPLNEINAFFTKQFLKMQQTITKCKKLEPDLMPFLALKKESAMKIQMDDPLITRYLKKIDDYLHEEFKKAEKIMKSYKQFNYLLSSKYLHHQKVNRIHKLIEVFSQ